MSRAGKSARRKQQRHCRDGHAQLFEKNPSKQHRQPVVNEELESAM
jgi:chromosome condensin MukBEF MukE localization factor